MRKDNDHPMGTQLVKTSVSLFLKNVTSFAVHEMATLIQMLKVATLTQVLKVATLM